MARCPECRKELPRGARMCTACGLDLASRGGMLSLGLGPSKRALGWLVSLATLVFAVYGIVTLLLPEQGDGSGPDGARDASRIVEGQLPAPRISGERPAAPRTDPGGWVTNRDYPSASLRAGEDGLTGFRLDIDENGEVIRCVVTRSSGFARLDETACARLVERAQFWPAQDRDGGAVAGSYSSAERWEIPL